MVNKIKYLIIVYGEANGIVFTVFIISCIELKSRREVLEII